MSRSCKPKVKLVERYLAEQAMDRANSYVIGDRATDIQLAENMGINGLRYDREALNWPMIGEQLIKRVPLRPCSAQHQRDAN